jgi:hypothetical protein
MGIQSIEESKKLKKEFNRLGRDGISERAIHLLEEYTSENPEHNYKEITKLIGRFHALYVAIDNQDYWKEVADRGYRPELYQLGKYSPSVVESQN